MVSEIQTEDDEMMDQLLKQGFLPLNTPVEKLGEISFSYSTFHIFFFSLCPRTPLSALLNCLFTNAFTFLFSPHLIMFFCFPVKWTVTVSKMAAQ